MSNDPYRGLIVNDFSFSDIGFVVGAGGVDGWRGGLSVTDRTTSLPGRVGAQAVARVFQTKGREIIIQGWQYSEVSEAELLDRIMELKNRLYEGTIEVSFSDDEEKIFFCRCMDVRTTRTGVALPKTFTRRAWQGVRINLLGADPLIYDKLGTIVGFSAAEGETPLGTATSEPTIRISGPVTNPVLTYKDFRGDTIATFGLTVTLAAGEFREIDMALSRVTDEAGANAIGEWSSGSFFVLDAQDAARESGPFPTLEVSPDADCDALFKRAWL